MESVFQLISRKKSQELEEERNLISGLTQDKEVQPKFRDIQQIKKHPKKKALSFRFRVLDKFKGVVGGFLIKLGFYFAKPYKFRDKRSGGG